MGEFERRHAARDKDPDWPAYLFEVKKPAESKSSGDVYKLVSTLSAAEAFRPLEEGGCALVRS